MGTGARHSTGKDSADLQAELDGYRGAVSSVGGGGAGAGRLGVARQPPGVHRFNAPRGVGETAPFALQPAPAPSGTPPAGARGLRAVAATQAVPRSPGHPSPKDDSTLSVRRHALARKAGGHHAGDRLGGLVGERRARGPRRDVG